MYASGAGLGASKGKDITKITELDYAGLARESVSLRFVNEIQPVVGYVLGIHLFTHNFLQARERYGQ